MKLTNFIKGESHTFSNTLDCAVMEVILPV